MATIVHALWLAAKQARLCYNDQALLATCPRQKQCTICLSLDGGHPRYGQLTDGEKDIRWPVSHDCADWLKCTTHWGDNSLKLSADQLLVLIDHRLRSIISHICQRKGHVINKLLTSSIQSLQGNLRLGLDWPRYGTVNTSTPRHFGLRFPCHDLTLS